jgi:hypothetical protein
MGKTVAFGVVSQRAHALPRLPHKTHASKTSERIGLRPKCPPSPPKSLPTCTVFSKISLSLWVLEPARLSTIYGAEVVWSYLHVENDTKCRRGKQWYCSTLLKRGRYTSFNTLAIEHFL